VSGSALHFSANSEIGLALADRERRNATIARQLKAARKRSRDPSFDAKVNRILYLYGVMDVTEDSRPGDPDAVICMDEYGPLYVAGKVQHLFAAYDIARDRLYGHLKTRKRRSEVLSFLRHLRSLYSHQRRIAIILDNTSTHVSTATNASVGLWAATENVELAYTPAHTSWLNRVEAELIALRYLALDVCSVDAATVRRYIRWRNQNGSDSRLQEILSRLVVV